MAAAAAVVSTGSVSEPLEWFGLSGCEITAVPGFAVIIIFDEGRIGCSGGCW